VVGHGGQEGQRQHLHGCGRFWLWLLYLGRVALEDGGARKKASLTGEETTSMWASSTSRRAREGAREQLDDKTVGSISNVVLIHVPVTQQLCHITTLATSSLPVHSIPTLHVATVTMSLNSCLAASESS